MTSTDILQIQYFVHTSIYNSLYSFIGGSICNYSILPYTYILPECVESPINGSSARYMNHLYYSSAPATYSAISESLYK